MKELLDAFWRAVAYCLHPRVIVLSIAPLVIAGGGTLALGWFFWDDAVTAVRAALDRWELLASFFELLGQVVQLDRGFGAVHRFLLLQLFGALFDLLEKTFRLLESLLLSLLATLFDFLA